jgi:hypothetical protein
MAEDAYNPSSFSRHLLFQSRHLWFDPVATASMRVFLRTWCTCLSFGFFGPLRHASATYSDETCCTLFKDEHQLLVKRNGSYVLPATDTAVCGQGFSPSVLPAPNAYVPYRQCAEQCKGFDVSKPSEPSTWAAPVVQFILPSIIFSMSIPRRRMFMVRFDIGSGFWSFLSGCALAFLTALDTIISVATILVLAGPLMVSGLTEAVLDFRVLLALKKRPQLSQGSKLRLIITVVCGNLVLQDPQTIPVAKGSWFQRWRLAEFISKKCRAPVARLDPLERIPLALEAAASWSDMKGTLLNLLSAQGDFGALIGAPVVFYLGGFVYTILDLLSKPSVQDAAISLAFGVEWMMIVHVAIVCGCLLASNNPSAASILASEAHTGPTKHFLPLVYDTPFQPVSMLWRGSNKEKWLAKLVQQCYGAGPLCPGKSCTMSDHKALRSVADDVRIGPATYWLLIVLPTLVLVSLPPAAGAVVAHQTPPAGWGCRSLTLVSYAGAQSLMVLCDGVRHQFRASDGDSEALPSNHPPATKSRGKRIVRRLVRTLLSIYNCWPQFLLAISSFAGFLSLFTALGGTIMQITGVYKNCFCYVNSGMWLDLDNAYVNVASDTADQRNASHNWIYMGCIATGFMATCCYVGWWYQQILRTKYRQSIENLPAR